MQRQSLLFDPYASEALQRPCNQPRETKHTYTFLSVSFSCRCCSSKIVEVQEIKADRERERGETTILLKDKLSGNKKKRGTDADKYS